MDINLHECEIEKMLKISRPVLLLEKVVIRGGGNSLVGEKRLGNDEFYWESHLIGDPVMPGTYQVEALGQAAALLDMKLEKLQNTPRLVKIDKVRFYREVKPNSVLEIKVEFKENRRGLMKCNAELYVKNKICCSAEVVHFVNPQLT
jgi:3-hydroxyacyl-[acyl-carrier-protein] dehydratase